MRASMLLLLAALAALTMPTAAAHTGTASVPCPPNLFLGLVPFGAHVVLYPQGLLTSASVFHIDLITRSPLGGCVSIGVQTPV